MYVYIYMQYIYICMCINIYICNTYTYACNINIYICISYILLFSMTSQDWCPGACAIDCSTGDVKDATSWTGTVSSQQRGAISSGDFLHTRRSTHGFVKVLLENENLCPWTKWKYSVGCHWTLSSPSLLKAKQDSINCTEMDGLKDF